MAKQNYEEVSTEKLKKLRLNYNLLGLLGLVVAICGVLLYRLMEEEVFRYIFYGSLIVFIFMGTFRTRAININKELKIRSGKWK